MMEENLIVLNGELCEKEKRNNDGGLMVKMCM